MKEKNQWLDKQKEVTYILFQKLDHLEKIMLASSIGQDILNTPNFKAFSKLAVSCNTLKHNNV
jgi:hypothetical protein